MASRAQKIMTEAEKKVADAHEKMIQLEGRRTRLENAAQDAENKAEKCREVEGEATRNLAHARRELARVEERTAEVGKAHPCMWLSLPTPLGALSIILMPHTLCNASRNPVEAWLQTKVPIPAIQKTPAGTVPVSQALTRCFRYSMRWA